MRVVGLKFNIDSNSCLKYEVICLKGELHVPTRNDIINFDAINDSLSQGTEACALDTNSYHA